MVTALQLQHCRDRTSLQLPLLYICIATIPPAAHAQVNGQYRCNGTECGDGGQRFDGVCDKDGCDMNPYRGGALTFYGPGSAPPPDGCNLVANSNNMGTIMGSPSVQTDPIGCCAVCNATAGCVGFTYVAASSNCFLKSSLGTPIADPGATSGSRTPPPTTAAEPHSLTRARIGGGLGFTLDTTQPFTVVTQFITSDGTDSGDLVEIRRSFVQVSSVGEMRDYK